MTDDLILTWRACWRSPSHLAVVHGPDAGAVVPLGPDAVSVGRRGADLEIADPALERRHLLARHRDGRIEVRGLTASGSGSGSGSVRLVAAPRGRRARERRSRRLDRRLRPPAGSADLGPLLRRVDGRGRRIGRRWREVRPGDELLVGTTRLQVRASPAHAGFSPDAADPSGPPPAGPGGSPTPRRRWLPLLTVVPALALLAVLLGGGQPSPTLRWVMLGAIALTLVVSLGAQLRGTSGRASRENLVGAASTAPGAARPRGPTDPAALAVQVAGTGRLDERWLPAADRPTLVDGGTPLAADPTHSGRDQARLAVPAEGLVLTGPGARAAARWVRLQLEVSSMAPAVTAAPATSTTATATATPAVPPVLAADSADAAPPGAWSLVLSGGRCGVGPAWCAAVVRGLRPPARTSLLADLLGGPTERSVASAWSSEESRSGSDLGVPLGVDSSGAAVVVDLVANGPHALVAGTTGSGKSELLSSWVLALALRHPPSRLHLLLVDYKGGSTFAAAQRLPHTVGFLTNLDGAASDRALATLRAELRRREVLVTAAGVRGVHELPEPPARLVVVVDELRALVEDSPDRLTDLVRLATQGRSLGIHLILATQRPSGVVSAQLRANVNLRICLRVLDVGDSTDVIGVGDAAGLTLEPGGVILDAGDGLRRGQVAWLPGTGAADLVAVAVAAADRLRRARREDLLRVHRPWLPELPTVVRERDLPALLRSSLDREGALLLLDEPEAQRRSLWHWPGGHLLISGEARSGRTTALRGVVAGVVAQGRPCHVVASGRAADWGGGGTTVSCDDPRRIRRLVTLLGREQDPGSVLVIDDVEQVVEALDAVGGPGCGTELLASLLRRAPVPVALATATPHRWAPLVEHHLALRLRDLGTAGMLGVPRALVSPGAPPGRGVLLGDGEPRVAQVVLPGDRAPRGAAGLVLAPLPTEVRLRDLLAAATTGAAVLGRGGDGADVVAVELEVGRPWLVAGPGGSGRSALLEVIAQQFPGAVRLDSGTTPERAATLLAEAAARAAAVVLVDDAESLDPALSDDIAGLVGRCRVVVATTTSAPQMLYRGVVAAVAHARTVVALGGQLPHHVAHARAALDPSGVPGRAVLVRTREVTALQLARP